MNHCRNCGKPAPEPFCRACGAPQGPIPDYCGREFKRGGGGGLMGPAGSTSRILNMGCLLVVVFLGALMMLAMKSCH